MHLWRPIEAQDSSCHPAHRIQTFLSHGKILSKLALQSAVRLIHCLNLLCPDDVDRCVVSLPRITCLRSLVSTKEIKAPPPSCATIYITPFKYESNLHLLAPCNDNADFCALISPTRTHNIMLVAGDPLISISVTIDFVLS
jgi:hypothetical protein